MDTNEMTDPRPWINLAGTPAFRALFLDADSPIVKRMEQLQRLVLDAEEEGPRIWKARGELTGMKAVFRIVEKAAEAELSKVSDDAEGRVKGLINRLWETTNYI